MIGLLEVKVEQLQEVDRLALVDLAGHEAAVLDEDDLAHLERRLHVVEHGLGHDASESVGEVGLAILRNDSRFVAWFRSPLLEQRHAADLHSLLDARARRRASWVPTTTNTKE